MLRGTAAIEALRKPRQCERWLITARRGQYSSRRRWGSRLAGTAKGPPVAVGSGLLRLKTLLNLSVGLLKLSRELLLLGLKILLHLIGILLILSVEVLLSLCDVVLKLGTILLRLSIELRIRVL